MPLPIGCRRQREGDITACGLCGLQFHAEQIEERDKVLVRNLVEPEDVLFGHPGEQFDQCDAGVADVVVGPAGRVTRDAALGFVYDLLEISIV